MELFLLRHGRAHTEAVKDSDRALDAKGREEVAQIMAANQAQLQSIEDVLVSPYLRAQQTCDIAFGYLPEAAKARCQTVDFLTPCSNPQLVLDYLFAQNYTSVICVSHQPLLGTLLDEICGFEPGQYRLGTSALACIHFPDVVARGLGELKWLKQP